MNQSTVKSYDSFSQKKQSKDKQKDRPYYSLTGEKVSDKYFQHDNMVPYFGAHIRTRPLDANSNEGILDNYQGQGSQTISKSEQSPLFAPGENYNYAFGTPNQNDFFQSRVNPSLRMANVKPFQEETVAPGLGLGYTTEGSGGYNSGMAMREKWLDRGVDELRVANHPKSSEYGLFGHEGPAISAITTRGEHAPVNKNQPEKLFELGHERAFTNVGRETAPTSRSIWIEKNITRPETTAEYIGGAGASVDQTYNSGEYMPSTHQDLGAVPVGVATGPRYAAEGDYQSKSLIAYPNNRVSNYENAPDNYFGVVSGVVNAAIAPLLDVLRPSRKENTIGNLRLYENAQSKVPNSYFFNPGDRTSTTNREMTENNKYIYGANANQRGGGYETAEYQPVHNARDTTTDFFYAGGSSAAAGTVQPRNYDAEYNQRNNDIKASTIDGRLVPGNMSLLGTDMNMRAREGEIQNNRPLAMTTLPTQLFTTNQMGKPGLETKPLYQNIELDRNSPEILNAFRSNPFTHSLTNIPGTA